jgi:hypothetical protein
MANLFLITSVGAAAPSTAQNKLVSSHTFPDLSIKEFQNKYFTNSVVNDRKVLLGSVGSDLWHGPGDVRDEFWMLTDRGPNGQIVVEGKNRRTFWVPEFNPAILKVKAAGDTIRILEVVPIVGRSGKPVTGLPNLKASTKRLTTTPPRIFCRTIRAASTPKAWCALPAGTSGSVRNTAHPWFTWITPAKSSNAIFPPG